MTTHKKDCSPDSGEKKWTCICGKPAPLFEQCSKECESTLNPPDSAKEGWEERYYKIARVHIGIGEASKIVREFIEQELTTAREEGRMMKGSSFREGYERGLREGRRQGIEEALEVCKKTGFPDEVHCTCLPCVIDALNNLIK